MAKFSELADKMNGMADELLITQLQADIRSLDDTQDEKLRIFDEVDVIYMSLMSLAKIELSLIVDNSKNPMNKAPSQMEATIGNFVLYTKALDILEEVKTELKNILPSLTSNAPNWRGHINPPVTDFDINELAKTMCGIKLSV